MALQLISDFFNSDGLDIDYKKQVIYNAFFVQIDTKILNLADLKSSFDESNLVL